VAKSGKATSAERYFAYINSPAWRGRRERYFEAIGGRRCELCGATEGVEVHHHTYVRLGRELDDDLLAVCKPHHDEIHAAREAMGCTLTQATRQVAAAFSVTVMRRRHESGLSRKELNKARKARRRERIAAQREAARS
jgi:hypothetical protein